MARIYCSWFTITPLYTCTSFGKNYWENVTRSSLHRSTQVSTNPILHLHKEIIIYVLHYFSSLASFRYDNEILLNTPNLNTKKNSFYSNATNEPAHCEISPETIKIPDSNFSS